MASSATPPAPDRRALQSGCGGERHGAGADPAGKIVGGIGQRSGFAQETDAERREPRCLSQEIGDRLLSARSGKPGGKCVLGAVGAKVHEEIDRSVRLDCLAQGVRQRIDRPALDAGRGDHQIAARGVIVEGEFHGLQGLSGKTVGKNRCPVDAKVAIGRFQFLDFDHGSAQPIRPGGIGAELRPAQTAERQKGRGGADLFRTLRRLEG